MGTVQFVTSGQSHHGNGIKCWKIGTITEEPESQRYGAEFFPYHFVLILDMRHTYKKKQGERSLRRIGCSKVLGQEDR